MRPIRCIPTKLPTPVNDVDGAIARCVMPIDEEEARAWDAVVASRLPKAA